MAPLVGALGSSASISLRAFNAYWEAGFTHAPHNGLLGFIGISIMRESLWAYLFVLPLLFVACWLGMRRSAWCMLLAALAALPVAYAISTPAFAWDPSDEELRHGTYWDSVIPYVLLASATRWVFAKSLRQSKPSQQS
jgi:hypothetical protein